MESNVSQKQELIQLRRENKKLQNELESAVRFVHEVKKGNLQVRYSGSMADHPLADSLELLRNEMANLRALQQQRNWANEGIAKFAEIIRTRQQESLSQLLDVVIIKLAEYVGASLGIISVLREEGEDRYLEQISYYACKPAKKGQRRFEISEGLAGQGFSSRKEIYLTKIPKGYLTISSGLGKAKPASVLVMPMLLDTEPVGVIELALFKELQQHEIDFIKEIGEGLASAYFNIKINDRTRLLLTESQQQEIQLKEQETELRRNMDELYTNQQQMHKIQLETEAQTKIINSLAIVSKADVRGDITYVNDEFVKWSQYTREEVMGKNHRFLKSGDQDDAIFKDLWKTISSGRIWRGEIKNKAKDGTFYWVDAIIAPVLDTKGKPKEYIAQRFVINDKKQREAEMDVLLEESQEKEEKLQANMDEMQIIQNRMQVLIEETEAQTKIINSLAIVSKADLRGDITYINDEFLRWSKYTREEVMGKNHRFLKSGDQHDAIFVDLWKTISSGRIWRGEIKNKAKDGSFYWVDAIIAPVLDANGKPKEYIAQRFVINDKKEREVEMDKLLSESQRKEEKLRVSMDEMQVIQNKMQVLIEETEAQTKIINSLAIVSKANIRGDITYVNNEFLKWSQYTREEVMGRNHRFLKSGDQDDAIFADLWKTISSGRIWRGEIKNRAKDGSFYWVDAIIAPVLDANGKPKEYIAQRFVINEKKEREVEMSKLLTESQQKEEKLQVNMDEMQIIQNKMQVLIEETEAQTKIINSLAIVSKANVRGDITYVNDEFVKWSQYSREEVMGKNHRFLKSGDQGDTIFADLWKTISSGRIWRGEIKNKAKDGSFYWVDAIIAPVLDANGKPKEYIAQRFVINDKKQREAEINLLLRESQQKEEKLQVNVDAMQVIQNKMQALIEETEAQTKIINSLAIVSKADVRGDITYVNDEFVKWSQYSREEVMGKNHRFLKSGDQDDTIFTDLWKTISSGRIWRGEIKNKARDGSFYWVDAIIAPVLDANGKPKEYIAQRFVINDKKEREVEMNKLLTESQNQEQELRINMDALQLTQDKLNQLMKETEAQTKIINGLAIVSRADVQGNITYVNDEFLKWSQYTHEEVMGKNHRFLKSGDQDDVIFADLWRTISSGRVWRGEIKNMAKDGSFYWVDAIIAPVLDEAGKPKEYIAQRFVINDKKEREEQMRQQNLVNEQAHEKVRRAYDELQVTQDQLVQTEKMAFLGRLTSGVAHEINTPLGAIKASSENVHMALDSILDRLRKHVLSIPRESVAQIFALIDFASGQKSSPSSGQRRTARREMGKQMEEAGIADADILAEYLVSLGVTQSPDQWMDVLRMPNAVEILGAVDEIMSVKNQNQNIGVAVSKASKILFALKKYSHQGQEEEASEFDVVENMETVLSIYSNNLKQLEVVKEFEPARTIIGYPDELNQVWTNLIHNSIQAMDGKGKITLSIRNHSADEVAIEVTDSGKGIAQHHLAKVFDPFFTTKAPGEGTGLGLSIVKKIIDKHNGKIECESELEKGTTFRVFLPVAVEN